MYISQVTFESDLEHREMIEGLMQSKKDAIEAAELVISSEVWWKEDSRSVGFVVVGKWHKKEDFQAWLKAIHPHGHKKRPLDAPPIRKTMAFYHSLPEHLQ